MVVEGENSIEEGLLQLKERNCEVDCRVTVCVLLSTFVAVSGSFSFGVSGGYTSGVELEMMKELGLSLAQFSLFASLSLVGAAIGALFCGKIAIVLGRKKTMGVSDILSIIGWLSIALAKNVVWLNFGRMSLGIGLGLNSYVVPIYIGEITPKHVRGALTFSNQLLQNSGLAMVYFCGNFISWRALALLGALPSFVQVIGLLFIPESPRWLAKVGKNKEFENSLLRLRGKDTDISHETSNIQIMTKIVDNDSKSSFCDLFQRKYRNTLVVGVGLMFIQQFSGSAGVVAYASSIFRKAGFSVAIGMTMLSLFMIPKVMIGILLVDKWGRRPLLLTSTFGMSITCLFLGVAFTLQKMHLFPEFTPILTVICIMMYIGTFAIGLGGLPWVIISEIFPMNIKVTAGSLVTLASFSFSSIITYAFNFLFEWSAQGTFYIFAGISAAALLFIWLLVPETKGLSLEEIQASFTGQPDQINQT